MQASEAIKVITRIGTSLAGRLWIFDALSFQSRTLKYKKNPAIQISKLIDYDIFCGVPKLDKSRITPQEVMQLAESSNDLQVIDVREEYEYQLDHINATLIPLSELTEAINEIDETKTTIIHCQSGKRSSQAILLIRNRYPNIKIYDLKGGLKNWRQEMGKINLP